MLEFIKDLFGINVLIFTYGWLVVFGSIVLFTDATSLTLYVYPLSIFITLGLFMLFYYVAHRDER